MRADRYSATVITGVILISISVITHAGVADITIVILFFIFMNAQSEVANIAFMVSVKIRAFSQDRAATVVANVIVIGICTYADCILATIIVAVVIRIRVNTLANFITAVVAKMIAVQILAIAKTHGATIIANMIHIGIDMCAHEGVANITVVIRIRVNTRADFLAAAVAKMVAVEILMIMGYDRRRLNGLNFLIAIIATIVFIKILAIAKTLGATIITNMIRIGIDMFAHESVANIAIVIRIRVNTLTDFLTAAVAKVIAVSIFADDADIATADITNVICRVYIDAFAKLCIAIIAHVIHPGILVNAEGCLATIVTSVILVCICVRSVKQTATAVTRVVFVGIFVRGPRRVRNILAIRV
jgi:hypothetical protein